MKNIEILAVLENLRLRHQSEDSILRIASACVAACFGYKSRAEWTEECERFGLVDYSDKAAAEINYQKLLKKAEQGIKNGY